MKRLQRILEWIGEVVRLRHIKKARRRQVYGMLVGLICSAIAVISLKQPDNEPWLSKGPLISGHKDLNCSSCHYEAEGTIRQQLQAKTKFSLGLRHEDLEFGTLKVNNAACQSCHDRPDDHHPVFRFNEARFSEARKTMDATQCSSCHAEHTATLASVPQESMCLSCHQNLKIKNDPLEIPHERLIANPLVISCLQCHDYHGNHELKLATSIKDTIPVQAILSYLRSGADPYAKEKLKKASTNNGK